MHERFGLLNDQLSQSLPVKTENTTEIHSHVVLVKVFNTSHPKA